MGPRIESHESIPHGHTSTAQVYQRRRDSTTMPRTFSSSYIVETSSDDTSTASPLLSRPQSTLVVSESQSSLLCPEPPSTPSKRTTSRGRLARQSSSFVFAEWKPILVVAWAVHFSICIFSIMLGSIHNHGERKYIPIDVDKVDDSCEKAFVDVFSQSIDDPQAMLCCSHDEENDAPYICRQPSPYLVLARRLARFPDAWLIPLFPLLVRGGFHVYRSLSGIPTSSFVNSENVLARRRLYLYLSLIQFRGWVLYMAFDAMEDLLVSDQESPCWYENLLLPHYHRCQGRTTDFSDHVVLYFAQILPIALMEVLHSFMMPFWDLSGRESFSPKSSCRGWTPFVLVAWMANLYMVTSLGAYKTAAYFHTGPEIMVGYLVSLLVQLPLCMLQCTHWFPTAREFFYGPGLV